MDMNLSGIPVGSVNVLLRDFRWEVTMSKPLKKPDASEILQAPDAPLVPPAALDRPPANWAEAAELAQWAEHEGPPPPADDEMSTVTDLSHGS